MVDPLVEAIVDDIRQHPKLVVADDFEVAIQRRLARSVTFKNGERVAATRGDRLWVSLRVLHRKRPGRAATEFRGREAVNQLVESAFESALRSSVDPWFRFPLWKQPRESDVPPAPAVDFPLPGSLFAKVLVPGLLVPGSTARPDTVEESYEEWSQSTLLQRKRERFQLRHRQGGCVLRFGVRHRAEEAADELFWVREERHGKGPIATRERHLEDLMLQSVALAEGPRFEGLPPGYLLLAPAATAALLATMSEWFHADRVQSGASPLADRRDTALFAPAIELVDHGRHPDSPDAMPFDLEGSLTQETVLVAGGVLRDFLYDTYAATRENRLSTGNFLRTADAPGPGVAPSVFFVRPSAMRAGALRRAMSRGLFLQTVSGVALSDRGAPFLTVKGTGWRVDGGACVEPLRDIALTLDALSLFRRAVGVGDDLAFFGRYGAPSILFEDVPLSDLS